MSADSGAPARATHADNNEPMYGARADNILALSPHFDDAVMGCGAFLSQHPASIVLTVCAGLPTESAPAPDWDLRCGFRSAREAMLARREENRQALTILRAVDMQYDALDDQYGGRGAGLERQIVETLMRLKPATVLLPLGLFHQDHIRVSNAALRARYWLKEDNITWIAYEEALYRRYGGLVQKRLAVLKVRHIQATPWLTLSAESSIKRQAVAAYASQLIPLGITPDHGIDVSSEHFWKLGDA